MKSRTRVLNIQKRLQRVCVRQRLCWGLTVSNHLLTTLPFPPVCCVFSMYFSSYEVLGVSEKVFAKCTETSQSRSEYSENKTIASFHLFCNCICRDVTVVSGPLFIARARVILKENRWMNSTVINHGSIVL